MPQRYGLIISVSIKCADATGFCGREMDRIHGIFQELQDVTPIPHPVTPEKSRESCPFFLFFES
jgi:hypothetical protein